MRKNTGHLSASQCFSIPLHLATASPAEQVGITFLERAGRCMSPFCIPQRPPLKENKPHSETLNTGTVIDVQNHMNGFFKVCNPMGVLPRNRDYNRDFAAWQVWSEQPWYSHRGRSVTEHRGMFACQAQFGTRLLANLICVALLIASQESLFIREKKKKKRDSHSYRFLLSSL